MGRADFGPDFGPGLVKVVGNRFRVFGSPSYGSRPPGAAESRRRATGRVRRARLLRARADQSRQRAIVVTAMLV